MMKSVDISLPTRKAHSATKVGQADRKLSSLDYKSNTKTTSCASASFFSRRGEVQNARPTKTFYDETLDNLKNSNNNREKLFLYASQVLGKLKKIIKGSNGSLELFLARNNESHLDANRREHNLKISFRKVNFYYDLLKRLLEERCVLLIKEESKSCLKQTQKLVLDLKILHNHEIIKLATMPIKSYNRFIDSSDISISVLEQLFKKVNNICDLHSSLKNNYQNIINFFHVGFDMELNQMLFKINKFQIHLFSETCFWTYKVLQIFILKLCLADPDSISPEFLCHVEKTCESFNMLFFDKKQVNYAYITNASNVLFNCAVQSNSETLLLDFILQYLSYFEAKVAAEKIIQYLIHECKNYECISMREQKRERDNNDSNAINSNTSDYYSNSPSIFDEVCNVMNTPSNYASTFENVFLSFIQRNQSLILKYLYSIICLDVQVPNKVKSETNGIYSDCSTVSKAWSLSQCGYKNRSYLCLAEKYWMLFWKKVLLFSVKLVLEVPCQQYGNSAIGIFLFWPHSYQHAIFKLLKFSSESKDILPSGVNVIKSVFHILLNHSIQESWDKNLSSALSISHHQYFMPIPVAENKARTRVGNYLCSCLESLKINFLKDLVISESLYLQRFYPIQVTLDCFICFTNIKTRASVSSADISTFLLISLSDCVYACKLLEERSDLFNRSDCFILSPSNKQRNCILKHIKVLSGHISEAPIVIQQVILEAVRTSCKKEKYPWRICNYNNSFDPEMFPCTSVDEILSCFTDVIDHIYNDAIVLSAITSAIAASLLSFLQSMHKKISLKKTQTVTDVLFTFLKWLDQINIDECEREKLKENKCLKKLLCIVHILESSLAVKHGYFRQMNNKISPLPDVTPEESMILTEEERLYWRINHRSHFIQCFC